MKTTFKVKSVMCCVSSALHQMGIIYSLHLKCDEFKTLLQSSWKVLQQSLNINLNLNYRSCSNIFTHGITKPTYKYNVYTVYIHTITNIITSCYLFDKSLAKVLIHNPGGWVTTQSTPCTWYYLINTFFSVLVTFTFPVSWLSFCSFFFSSKYYRSALIYLPRPLPLHF